MDQKTIALMATLMRGSRVAEARLDAMVAPMELSTTKLLTLRHLTASPEPVTLGALAACMAFVKSNVTQLIDHLEAASLVHRLPNRDDRRCTHIEITERGNERLAEALAAIGPLGERIERLLTPEERERLADLLQRLIEGLR